MLMDQCGATVDFADHPGASMFLLVFVPAVHSPVCRQELVALEIRHEELSTLGVEVIALSTDPHHSIRAYAEEHGLSFPVLSDFWPHGATAKAYGVFNEQSGMATRVSFLVDQQRVIRHVFSAELTEPRSIDEYLLVIRESLENGFANG